MARYSATITKASAAAAGWVAGLRCPAAVDARIWEIYVFTESAVAGAIELKRVTTAGTGAATSVVPVAEDYQSSVATTVIDTAFATAAPLSTGVSIRRYSFPATVGQGIMWQFPTGLCVPAAGAIGIFQTSILAVTYGVTFVLDQ
jgi:hypothetical protein